MILGNFLDDDDLSDRAHDDPTTDDDSNIRTFFLEKETKN